MSKKGVTPGSVKTVSDNEHGNVYHDENGLMTSPEKGVSSDVEELGGDFDLTDEGEFADLELDLDLTDEGEFAELDLDFELENEGPIGGLSDDEVLEKIEEVKTILNNDELVSHIASLDLETKINEFIKDKKVKDIQFTNSVSIFAEEQIYCFSAMIIYEI